MKRLQRGDIHPANLLVYAQAKRMRDEGKTTAQIRRATGVAKSLLSHWARKARAA